MAVVDLNPVTLNPVIVQGAGQTYLCPTINDLAGTPVNLSAWDSLAAELIPVAPNPTGAPVSFGTVIGAASGVLKLRTSDSDLTTVAPGSAKLVIHGKPTAGDGVQILAIGTATISAG